MGTLPLLFLLAAAAETGAQLPEQTSRSRDELLALPPAEAADALLGNIASRFATMTVEKNGDVPVAAAFATAPQATGLPGLCEATVLRINLVREENRGEPPEIRSYSVSQVYKVVSEVDGPLGPLSPNDRQQARLCAAAGPVVVSSEEARAPRFFHYRGYGEPWVAVAALQGAIRDARARRYGPIACTRREPGDCRDANAEFAALDLRNLASIEVVQPDPEQPDFIAYARFIVEPGRNSSFGWRVSLEFNGELIPVQRTQRVSFVYGRTRLYRY